MSHASVVASPASPSSKTIHRSNKVHDTTESSSDPQQRQSTTTTTTTTANSCYYKNNNVQQENCGNISNDNSHDVVASSTISEDAEKRRKAAAAAARKRRQRKIHLSRHSQQYGSPRSVSQSRLFNGPPLSALDVGGKEEDLDNFDSSTNYPSALVPMPAQLALPSTTPSTIRSSLEGMAEVVNRWNRGEIVAIPTECTYEACISLRTSIPSSSYDRQDDHLDHGTGRSTSSNDWAYRIESLRQAAMGGNSSSWETTRIAIPEKLCMGPYCWIPPIGSDCVLLRDCFPSRVYAMKDASAAATISTTTSTGAGKISGRGHHHQHGQHHFIAAHRFNESYEVIRRIARHVWPGPVTLHVELPEYGGGDKNPIRTLCSILASFSRSIPHGEGISEIGPGRFLTLRCPRHPLAIKALQKIDDGDDSENQHPLSNGGQPSNADPIEKDISILVGFPIYQTELQSTGESVSSVQYCRSSKEVLRRYTRNPNNNTENGSAATRVSAVLDGEDSSDVFAIPTCEYGQPPCAHAQVWILGSTRTIVTFCNGDDDNNNNRASSSSLDNEASSRLNFLGGGHPSSRMISETRLRAALSQPVSHRLSKVKERIIQAVLCRWKIVERNVSSSSV